MQSFCAGQGDDASCFVSKYNRTLKHQQWNGLKSVQWMSVALHLHPWIRSSLQPSSFAVCHYLLIALGMQTHHKLTDRIHLPLRLRLPTTKLCPLDKDISTAGSDLGVGLCLHYLPSAWLSVLDSILFLLANKQDRKWDRNGISNLICWRTACSSSYHAVSAVSPPTAKLIDKPFRLFSSSCCGNREAAGKCLKFWEQHVLLKLLSLGT